MPNFVNAGVITAEGKQVIEYMEGKINEAAKQGADALNGLPGYMKHYHVNVMTLEAYGQAEWLRDFSAAHVAWGEVQALQEADKREQAQDDQNKALVEQMETLKTELAAANQKIAALEEVDKGGKGKKPAKTEPADDKDEADS